MTRWTNTILMMALAFGAIVFTPAGARASGCTTRLMDCYTEAAKIDDFWYRTAAGIDCEIDYAACLRDKLLEA